MQAFKKVGQDEAVIAVEHKPLGECCVFAFGILLDGNVSTALRKMMFSENFQCQWQ